MLTENSNFKGNRNNKAKSKSAYKEARNGSSKQVRVKNIQTAREKTVSDSSKNAVGKIQKRVTYADVILGNTGERK